VLGISDVEGSTAGPASTTSVLPIASAIARRTRTSRSAGLRLGISVKRFTEY
jgi:hypothetical protein